MCVGGRKLWVVKEEKKVNAAWMRSAFSLTLIVSKIRQLQLDFKPFSPQAVCSASLYSFHIIWPAFKMFSLGPLHFVMESEPTSLKTRRHVYKLVACYKLVKFAIGSQH